MCVGNNRYSLLLKKQSIINLILILLIDLSQVRVISIHTNHNETKFYQLKNRLLTYYFHKLHLITVRITHSIDSRGHEGCRDGNAGQRARIVSQHSNSYGSTGQQCRQGSDPQRPQVPSVSRHDRGRYCKARDIKFKAVVYARQLPIFQNDHQQDNNGIRKNLG